MPDLLLVLVSVLAGATVIVALEYYRQLREAQKEYEKAKAAVDDIVLSFNRQFKHESDRLEALAYKIEAGVSKADNALKRGEELNGLMRALEGRIVTDSKGNEAIYTRLDKLETEVTKELASQDATVRRLASLEEQAGQLRLASEINLEGVIPLKRDRAMAQLTSTEVAVLELLVSDGAKTAPEIKEKVNLSREHTARLMKKLYEGGYLERETAKIPFKYSVKKEMEKLLKKTESQAT